MYYRLRAITLNPLLAITRLGRNVVILSVCQALGFSGVPLILLAGGIVSSELAPSPAWATLPIAFVVVGIALFTIPAALIMNRIGRKRGFIIAAIVAAVAALGAALAIAVQSFFLFCLMMLFMGGNTAFVMQYRFAASESVERKYAGRAVSFVLVGGIIAGFLGPEIGRDAKDWLGYGGILGVFCYHGDSLCCLCDSPAVYQERHSQRRYRQETPAASKGYCCATHLSGCSFF